MQGKTTSERGHARRLRGAVAATASLVLTSSLAAVLGAPAATASTLPGGTASTRTAAPAATSLGTTAAADATVVARTGDLTTRPAGYPQTDVPARQLQSAKVRQDLERERLSATVVLKQAPTPDSTAFLSVVFGQDADGKCTYEPEDQYTTLTTGTPTDHFTRDGSTFRLRHGRGDAGSTPWDCAFAVLSATDDSVNYDGLVGDLTEVHAQPRLRVGKVTQLSSAKRPVKLVRGVWTWLHVTVRNTGPADAFRVRLRGSGKGLKVRKVRVGRVFSDHRKTVRIRVKLTTSRKRGKLRLVARNGVSRDPKRIRFKRVPRPRRPVAGTYRNEDGDVTFRIRDGKVVKFRAFAYTTCGGINSVQHYDHPRTRIPRDGLVDDYDRHENFTTHLEMKVVGRRVTRGKFLYYGPGSCRAGISFSARRKG